MDREIWRTEPDGQISAELQGLKLIIRHSVTWARYVILQSPGYGGSALGPCYHPAQTDRQGAKDSSGKRCCEDCAYAWRRRRSVVHLEK